MQILTDTLDNFFCSCMVSNLLCQAPIGCPGGQDKSSKISFLRSSLSHAARKSLFHIVGALLADTADRSTNKKIIFSLISTSKIIVLVVLSPHISCTENPKVVHYGYAFVCIDTQCFHYLSDSCQLYVSFSFLKVSVSAEF